MSPMRSDNAVHGSFETGLPATAKLAHGASVRHHQPVDGRLHQEFKKVDDHFLCCLENEMYLSLFA